MDQNEPGEFAWLLQADVQRNGNSGERREEGQVPVCNLWRSGRQIQRIERRS